MENKYDVVIVGAGISGLECATILADSELSVLVIDKIKESDLGNKVCANGIFKEDLHYINKEFTNSDFQSVLLKFGKKEAIFPLNEKLITTIDRPKLLQSILKKVRQSTNVEVIFEESILKIKDGEVETRSGQTIGYKYLVGADGSNSLVRRFLKLPEESDKYAAAIQYLIPEMKGGFKVIFDPKLIPTGYIWYFPWKNQMSIGCGVDRKSKKVKDLKEKFTNWLKSQNINLDKAVFQGHTIRYGYAGYKFGNIFLAGDAAGLASGLTGKGIFAAFLSGQQIGLEILGENKDNLIEKWLIKKQKQEKFLKYLKNPITARLAIDSGFALLKLNNDKINQKIIRNI